MSNDDLFRAGVAARREGRWIEAIEALTTLTARQPDHADAQVQLGLAYGATGRVSEAKAAFRQALTHAPGDDDARLGLARTAFWTGDLDAAERELAALGASAAGSPDAQALRGQVAAARSAAQAPAAPPASIERAASAPETRAEPARAARPPSPAAKTEATVTKPAAPDRLAAALAHRKAGRFRAAEDAYRGVLARFPKDADRWVDLGIVRAFQGPTRFADARTALSRALALSPDHLDASLGLARVDLYESALDAAARRVDAVLARVPDHGEALGLQARIRLAKGDASGAETDFAGLVAKNPKDVEALTGLGDARRAQYRDAEAHAAFQQALALDPTSQDVRKRLEAPVRPRWLLSLNGGGSELSAGFKPWREGGVRLGYRFNEATVVSAGAEVTRRFDLVDTLVDARIDHRWSDTFASYFRVGGTSAPHYRPALLVEGGGSARLSPGLADGTIGATVATVDLGFARYDGAGDVKAASIGLEQYVMQGRLWFTAKAIGTISATEDRLAGFLVRADVLVTDRLQLFVGYADAPDSSDGQVYPSRSLFGGAIWSVTDTLTFRVTAAREDRVKSYDRTILNLGLSVGF
ncbi:MAG TPA: tetratricopeptide repeat protein [Beijerinckiaceae bacterium]|jgi:YaiO family outer membrane protein